MLTPEQVQRHEAGHAAGFLTLGVPVRFVDTIGNDHCRGFVMHDLEVTDRESALKQAKGIMCAWIEEVDHSDELKSWPLDVDSEDRDERKLAIIAEYLGWDADDYRKFVAETCTLTLTPTYQAILNTILGTLDYSPQLDHRWLKATIRLAVNRFEED